MRGFNVRDFIERNNVDEDLIHAINGTELLTVLVPEFTKIVKEAIGGWHHVQGNTKTGDIDIIVCKEKFYPGNFGSQSVGSVRVNSHEATLTCYGLAEAEEFEMQDPNCFTKLEEWCKKLADKNPWERRSWKF